MSKDAKIHHKILDYVSKNKFLMFNKKFKTHNFQKHIIIITK